jgi:hypothetical protein
MKTLKILLILLLLLAYFQRSLAGNPVWLSELQAPQIGLSNLKTEPAATPSILIRNPDYCKQYRRQEITGWVLLGVGAGSIAGGSYMIYKGVTGIINSNSSITVNDVSSPGVVVSRRDITYISVGAALGFAGLVLTPTGLALGITGTVRYNKFCGRTSYLITPALDNNGMGISAYF